MTSDDTAALTTASYPPSMGRSGDKGLVVAAAALALTGVVALLDYPTPTDADFGGFYMLPVILAAWFVGRKTGVAIALLGMATEAFVDTTLRLQGESASVAIAAWNASTHFLVLSAIALITDGLYRQRKRWQELDAERTTLLRVLEQELPGPLRAADWFARTFEDALASSATPAVKAQFTALRHHTSEAMFLATDLLALGKLRMGGIRFARAPVVLKAVAAEAVDASLDRSRVSPQQHRRDAGDPRGSGSSASCHRKRDRAIPRDVALRTGHDLHPRVRG